MNLAADGLPIEPSALLPFLAAVTLIEITPGPNMGYLASLSASEGRAAGFKAVIGVTLGLTMYMLAAVVGVAELLLAAPIAYAALQWAGVLFLFYLAWEAWRGAGETSPGHAGAVDQRPFWRGFIANVLNPKAAVFYVTLLPTFIAQDHAAFWVQALILGLVHLAVSFLIHSAIVLGASRAAAFVVTADVSIMFRRSMALCIGLMAAWLAWQTL